jgi:hypothetical protein
MRQLLADISAGFGISIVNDIPAFWPTVVIVVLRIVLEWMILRNKNKKA